MPGGIQWEITKEARQEAATYVDNWVSSPDLQPPDYDQGLIISLGINLLRMKGGLVGLRTLDGLRDAIE